MSSTELADKAAKHLLWERAWTKHQMRNDPLFNRLGNVRRDFSFLGKLFVAWTIVDGEPLIDTLFRADRFGANGSGLSLTVALATASRPSDIMRLGHVPAKVPHLDLYLWIPYYAEVRVTPVHHDCPDLGLVCTYPLLVKYDNPLERGQKEGHLYFAPKSEFAKLWPKHDF